MQQVRFQGFATSSGDNFLSLAIRVSPLLSARAVQTEGLKIGNCAARPVFADWFKLGYNF